MDTKIVTFFSSYDAAWNQRDAEAFTSLFLDNASAHFFMLDGNKIELNSRAELLEFYIPNLRNLQDRPTVTHKTEIKRTQNTSRKFLLTDGESIITEINAEGKLATLRKWAVSFLLTNADACRRILSLRAFERPLG